MKTKFALLFLIASMYSMYLMCGCSNEQDHEKTVVSVENRFTLKSALQAEDKFVNLRAYTFKNGLFDRSINNIIPKDKNFSITTSSNAPIYFISNIESEALNSLQSGTTSLNNFLSLSTESSAVHTETSAPEFFSGVCTPTGASAEVRDILKMIRSTARLDFDMTHNSKIKINRIIVPEASATTSLFAGPTPSSSEGKVRYERTYTAEQGDELIDQFRIYESNTPLEVIIIGTYDTTPTSINVSIPNVKRNMIYRIKIKSLGTGMDGSITVSAWGNNGSSIDAQPI